MWRRPTVKNVVRRSVGRAATAAGLVGLGPASVIAHAGSPSCTFEACLRILHSLTVKTSGGMVA